MTETTAGAMRGDASVHRDQFRTIVQISDIHLTAPGVVHADGIDTLGLLDSALAAIIDAAIPIHGILLTGDAVDHGDAASYQLLESRLRPVLEQLEAPLLAVPGNHDELAAFRRWLGRGESQAPVDSVLDLGDLRVVGLDSSRPGLEHGELDDGQLDWLGVQLAGAGPWGAIVALHHPPATVPLGTGMDICLRNPDRLAEALRGTSARLVLAGHTHFAGMGTIAGIPLWLGGAVCSGTVRLAPGMRTVGTSLLTRIDVSRNGVLVSSVPVGHDAAILREIPRALLRYAE